MKISHLWRRVLPTSFLTLMLFCISDQSLAIGFPPLAAVSCEAILRSAETHETHEDVLPVLREAIYRIRSAKPESNNDGITYEPAKYVGPPQGLTETNAARIISRLNGLEEQASTLDSDVFMMAFEIRGADIQNTLDDARKKEAELTAKYQAMRPTKQRIMNGLANTLVTYGLLNSILVVTDQLTQPHTSLPITAFWSASFLISLAYYGHNFVYGIERYDWTSWPRKLFLEASLNGDHRDDIYITSTEIKLPLELIKNLWNAKAGSIEQGHSDAYQMWGKSHLFYFGDLVTDTPATDIPAKNVYLDNIIYYDHVTNEPVWLYFFRVFRANAVGRPPRTRKRDVQNKRPNLTFPHGLQGV